MELEQEEIQDLIILLQVAHNDASVMQKQSHDHEEIEAYKEHKSKLFKWIVRLGKEVESKKA